jgi:cyclopropane fatty-acyl-phospholipid synthase-like methyltransferase
MKIKAEGYGYNERLFSSGPRKWLHLARFRWLRDSIRRFGIPTRSVFELGCFDGKALDYLPDGYPQRYRGFDTNSEGGLDIARTQWKDHPQFKFNQVQTLEQIDIEGDAPYDLAIAMETLEHLPPEQLDAYLGLMAHRGAGTCSSRCPTNAACSSW